MEQKKLYKSRKDKKIDGVCAGIAEYFGIDSTLVRLAWVFLILVAGTGVVAYIACMLVIPVNPNFVDNNVHNNNNYNNANNNVYNNNVNNEVNSQDVVDSQNVVEQDNSQN